MDLSKLKEGKGVETIINKKEELTPQDPPPTPAIKPTPPAGDPPPTKVEPKFQHYASSVRSVKLLTDTGKKITFVNFQFITQDEEIIAYLDKEIACSGIKGFTKGAFITAEEADPMSAVKKKWKEECKAEMRAEQEKKALGEIPDMGDTRTDKSKKFNAVTTSTIADNAAGSSSAPVGK